MCFGSAQDGEAKKPGADAKDARKGAPPDRVVARVGSGESVHQLDLGIVSRPAVAGTSARSCLGCYLWPNHDSSGPSEITRSL